MSTWSLVSVSTGPDAPARVAALSDGRLTTVPAFAAYQDLRDVIADWATTEPLLRGFDPSQGEPIEGTVLAPLRSPGKVICAGANYRDHLREMGITDVPDGLESYFFLLPTTAIVGPGEAIVIPQDAGARVDWEAELTVVIGRAGRDIAEADALDHVAGYTIMNDISARGYHKRSVALAPPFTFDWLSSKGRDTFCPLGDGITPAFLVPDPQDLPIRQWRNGILEQDGTTAEMIFPIRALIAAASAVMTLEPGDIIATGTPAGVGAPRQLSVTEGDVLRVEIPGVATLENPIRVAQPLATVSATHAHTA